MPTLTSIADMIDLHQGAIEGLNAAERLIEEARCLGCSAITGLHGPTSPASLLIAVAQVRKDVTTALNMIADKTPSSV